MRSKRLIIAIWTTVLFWLIKFTPPEGRGNWKAVPKVEKKDVPKVEKKVVPKVGKKAVLKAVPKSVWLMHVV